MAETTEEFAHRFTRAVEGHPLAPPTPHGRQSWVKEKLEKEAGVKVSHNTMSKWFHGHARPRQDSIRALAKVLSVDEVWLAMGQKPNKHTPTMPDASTARGAALAFAGLVEMAGGKVAFSAKPPVDMHINIGSQQFGAIVVSPSMKDKQVSMVIPEPVEDARVFALVRDKSGGMSACITVYDVTDIERESLGGFSVLRLEKRPNGKLKIPGVTALLAPLESIEKIADPA
jgi:transcriptional regulator with XRE-family HTH domain